MVSYPETHDVDEGDISLGNDAASIAHDFKEKLFFELAKFPGVATTNDCSLALSFVIRDRLLHRWVEAALFEPLMRTLLEHDPFFVLADFRAYVDCQDTVSRAWATPDTWTRSAVRNVAGMGTFSSDRSIREYSEGIWKVPAVPIAKPNEHS
jgi:glucan phosphorylase